MIEFTPKSREDWRKWLEKNHLKENKVLLIKHKKHTGKYYIPTQELMHEAICFGWIDTTAKRRDKDTYTITYVKRNKNSKWSINTLKYGKDLYEKGLMSQFGLKMYKEGLSKKPHDAGIPKNPEAPIELKERLNKNPILKQKFEKIAPSTKKLYFRQILKAKLPETKEKRINDFIKVLMSK